MSVILYNFEYPKRLKAAVIGCGGHAFRNIFPTFQYAPVELVAACDIDLQRAESVGSLFGAKRFYASHIEMLDVEKPDVVFAVLNYDEHGHPRYPAIAIDAMRSGSHAWIEKPPASSSAEIREMMAVSAETGKFVGVGFKKMFFPANVKAKELTERSDFGEICTITARYPQALPPLADRSDDRAMAGFLDHIVHPYSVLRFLGGQIESLFVQREDRSGGSQTVIRFRSGAVGALHLPGNAASFAPMERTEIIGTKGMVVVDNNIRVSYYRSSSGLGYGRDSSFFGADDAAPLHWEPEFSLGQLYNKGIFLLGYAPEIIAFCDCVLSSQPPAKGNLDDALEIMRIYEAYRKADGEVVRL